MNEPVIKIKDLKKIYDLGDVKVKALRGVSLEICKGEYVAIMGASGSGKSTLMNLIGCLDKPTSGEYFLDGINVKDLSKDEASSVRNKKIGFVFQGFNLLPRTTALENVELPLMYDKTKSSEEIRELAIKSLQRVGLGDRIYHEPNQLSGGQQQRVAIARALVNNPSIILADEPTGNLDSRTSLEVFSLFKELNDQGITIVLVTHERDFAKYAKRIIEIRDGLIRRDFILKKRIDPKDSLRELDEKGEDIIAISTEL